MRKILAIAVLFSFLTAPVYAQGKMGFVNMEEAFDKYKRTQEEEGLLKKEGEGKEEERERKVEDIEKMRKQFELLSDKGKEAKKQEIEEKIEDLREFERRELNKLRKERNVVMKDILDDIYEVVKDYGKRERYDLILTDREIIYSSDALDLTDEIVKELNGKYGK